MDPSLLAMLAVKEKKAEKKKNKKDKTKAEGSGSQGSKSSFSSFSGSSVAEKRKAEQIEQEKEVSAARALKGFKQTDDQLRVVEKKEEADWSDAPETLQPYTAFGPEPNPLFVEHFVRFMVGQWRLALQKGSSFMNDVKCTESETASFRSGDVLKETETSLAPLINELRRNPDLVEKDDGDKMVPVLVQNGQVQFYQEMKAKDRDAMEDNITRPQCTKHLVRICTLAADRDYAEANKVYIHMTGGNKKCHATSARIGVFQQNKGARIFKTIQDRPNLYDTDPIAQKYILAVRKLVRLAQILRPNDDVSRHMDV